MALTQDQVNSKDGFVRVKKDIKERHPSVIDANAVSAFAGAVSKLITADGETYNYVPNSTATPVGKFILPATGKGGSGRWFLKTTRCNVLDFSADNNAGNDSAPAFDAAIAYARTLSALNGGTFRYYIEVPPGWYLLRSTPNFTNCNGITILGLGGSYINTGFIGCTSNSDGTGPGVIFDFTGSTRCLLKNVSITAASEWGPTASKIGVQFALSADSSGNQIGGLNCGISNVYVQMYDTVSTLVNGGIGTIGILNIRSEEFGASDCYVKANLPMCISNNANMATAGYNHTFTSNFANIAPGPGSMGVVDCYGQMSLQAIQRRQPGLMLINTNSVRYHGYISRESATLGTGNTAVQFVAQNDNAEISGTVESFSRIAKFGTLTQNVRLNITTANHSNPTTDVIDVTGATLYDCEFKVNFGNDSEFNNGRTFLYHAPTANGDQPATGGMANTTITCGRWADNTLFVSANILRNSSNCRFNSGQPFVKRNHSLIDVKTYPVPLGQLSAGNPPIVATLIRFSKADCLTKTSNNGGFYNVVIRGVIHSGGLYQAGGIIAAEITANCLVSQNPNSTLNGVASSASILSKTATALSYINITAVAVTVDLTGSFGLVKLTIDNAGNGIGESLVFVGTVEIGSNFRVNQSVILS